MTFYNCLTFSFRLSLVFSPSKGREVQVFTPLFLITFIVGSVILLAVYIAFIVLVNSPDFSVITSAVQNSTLAAGIFVLIFGVATVVVIAKLASSLSDPDVSLKRVSIFIARLLFNVSRILLKRLIMAIVFAAVLIPAGILLIVGIYATYALENGFGIGVSIELLQQIAFGLVIGAFWPQTSIITSSSGSQDGNTATSHHSSVNTGAISLTMEIDD